MAGSEPSYAWVGDGELDVDGVRFVATTSRRFASTRDKFYVAKRPDLVQNVLNLLDELEPSAILELGILQGGSCALMALAAEPELLLAVERNEERVAALDDLVNDRGLGRAVHAVYGIDQGDVEALRALMDQYAPSDGFDLVVDDASHLVEPTRASFNVIFPHVKPGGLFIIEDWSWAHIGFGSHLPNERPLTELVFELTMAMPSRPGLIADLRIDRDWAVVVRGDAVIDRGRFDISSCYNDRGRQLLASSKQ